MLDYTTPLIIFKFRLLILTKTNLLIGSAISCSILLLATAFFFDYFLEFSPCKLCLWQRWAHFATIFFGVAGLLGKNLRLFWIFLAFGACFIGTIVAAYHLGIENAYWEGPATCSSIKNMLGTNPDVLLEKILTTPVVKCDTIPWSFFKLSIAGWNFIISTILSILWIYGFIIIIKGKTLAN